MSNSQYLQLLKILKKSKRKILLSKVRLMSQFYAAYQLVTSVKTNLTHRLVFYSTAQKVKFSMKDFLSKWDQIRRKLHFLCSVGNAKAEPLVYVDDLVDINYLDSDTTISSKNAAQYLKCLKYDSKNCKTMPVNYHKPTSVASVNGSKIELFTMFYYLGDTLNAKRNNDFQKENSKILFKKRIAKFYGKIIGIIAICKKSCMGQYELGVLLKIHEVFFVSSLLFKCQS